MKAVKNTFDAGYLLDPHTATCIKSSSEDPDKSLQHIIYSTAEWTKFAPAISCALGEAENQDDLTALSAIARKASIQIPLSISDLFNREIVHQDVIDPQAIESNILDFYWIMFMILWFQQCNVTRVLLANQEN